MSKVVYIEPCLMEGEELRLASFVKEFDNSWVLQSASPKIKNIDEYEKTNQENAIHMYPELKELFDCELELEESVFFRKGMNSGKWYDFH